MERLFATALLCLEGFEVWDNYESELDKLFIEYSDSDELLYLESLTGKKDIILHTVTLMNSTQIDINSFGMILMAYLFREYQKDKAEINSFANKTYMLWHDLPSEIASIEPFHILSYADDPLSWGDERQCRELYEKAFNYYEVQK